MDYKKESEVLKALGHPIRLRMVEGLLENECNVTKITDILNIPQSTTAQHLGILKSRGIIGARKEGVKTCYKVIDKRVKRIVSALNESKQK